MRNAIAGTTDAYKLLHITVPGCNILVAYRPIYPNTLLCISLKIKVAPALSPARPHQRFTTCMIASYPCKWLMLYVRMLIIFYKEMLCGFAKCVTLAYNRVFLLQRLSQYISVREFPGCLRSSRIIFDVLYIS